MQTCAIWYASSWLWLISTGLALNFGSQLVFVLWCAWNIYGVRLCVSTIPTPKSLLQKHEEVLQSEQLHESFAVEICALRYSGFSLQFAPCIQQLGFIGSCVRKRWKHMRRLTNWRPIWFSSSVSSPPHARCSAWTSCTRNLQPHWRRCPSLGEQSSSSQRISIRSGTQKNFYLDSG